MDLTRWNDGTDAELEELVGGDLELLDLGRRLRASRPEPRVDPEFQRRLRAQLMTAAETQVRPRGLARLLRPRARLFAYGAAGLGTAMAAAAALAYYAPHSDHLTFVQGVAAINEQHSVNPDDVIRISFNQSMDRRAVERGLTIQPAVDYTPTWQGNELTITPKHNLQPNSPYVVTIPRSAARDVRGDVASKDITITFGTSPAPVGPPVRAAGPMTLLGHDAGAVVDGSLLGFAGDGSLLAAQGLVAPAPTASAGGTTPVAGDPATTPAPAPALVRYGSDGAVRLGDPVTAIALSPAGHSLATLTASGVVAVSDMDGSHRSVLSTAADANSPLGWGGDDTRPVVLFLSGGRLTSVDLEHSQRTVSALRVDPAQVVRLAPLGRYAFVGPAPAVTAPAAPSQAPAVPPFASGPLLPINPLGNGSGAVTGAGSDASTNAFPSVAGSSGGQVVDLGGTQAAPAAAPLPLTGLGAHAVPVFSGDGTHVAWIDRSGAQPVLSVQQLGAGGPATHVTLTLGGGDDVTGLALDTTGERVAYAITHADGSGDLRVVHVADGVLLATGAVHQPSGLVFSPDGGQLGYLRRGATQTLADVATVPGGPGAGSAVPTAASTAIDDLVAAEVAGAEVARQDLDALVAPTVEPDLLTHLPGGLTRGYVISAVPSSGGDLVTAQIRLLRDPTNDHPTALFTDQTVTLRRAGEKYRVATSDISRPLHDEPRGPQVVHVDTSRILTLTTVRITFDSDLDPSSVTSSVIGGIPAILGTPTVKYEPGTRTVVVSFLGRIRQAFDLTVDIGLRDVNGQGLAQQFTTTVTPGH